MNGTAQNQYTNIDRYEKKQMIKDLPISHSQSIKTRKKTDRIIQKV